MAEIRIRIGPHHYKRRWPEGVPVELAQADLVLIPVVASVSNLSKFALQYIGGWVWQVRVDGRLIGSVVVLTDM